MHKVDINRISFFKNIGVYISLINAFLSRSNKLEPLGNHIKMVGGFEFKSNDYKNKGIPVIRISDFQNEIIQLSKVKYYQESVKLEKYELKEGDIIIAMTGGTIGKLAIVQASLGKLYLNQRVGKFQVINKEKFDKEYVYWIARGIQGKLQNIGYGGAQPNISNSQIEKLEFPFPDKPTQKIIVRFLNDLKNDTIKPDEYFDSETEKEIYKIQSIKIKTLELDHDIKEQLTLLTKLRQSIIQDAIQGKLTKEWREQNSSIEHASELLKKIKAEKERVIKEKKIKKDKPLPKIRKDEIPFEIPESWEFCRMLDISEKLGAGSTPKGGNSVYVSNGIMFFRSQNIYNHGLKLDNVALIPDNIHKKMKGTKVLPKDILLNITGGSIGRCTLIHDDFKTANVSQHVAIVRMINLNTRQFIHNLIISPYFQSRIMDVQVGVSREGLSMTSLKKLLVPFPPLEEQKVILEKISQLLANCDVLEKEIKASKTNTEKLMQSVLSKLLGEENNILVGKKPAKKAQQAPPRKIKYNSKTINMDLVTLLKENGKLHAEDLWKMSEFPKDIDKFYEELKKQIEVKATIKESVKKGYLELV
jgi:type I restriction enzyme S subunit